MLLRLLGALVTLVVVGSALSQAPTLTGEIASVEVQGTDSYRDIVRAIIGARAGTRVERIDLEAERNRIYSLGLFDEVTVRLENRAGGPVLVIEVVENPPIGAIEFEGNDAVSDERLAEAVQRQNLLAPGRVYNTIRAEDAIATIRAAYRNPGQAPGFPYDVGVQVSAVPDPELAAAGERAPIRLTYTIDEAAPIRDVEFEGATVLDQETLESIFAPLEQRGRFDLNAYRQAVQQVGQRYFEQGYRGSGVDPDETTLEGGTLTVHIEELTIASIDTTQIGVDPTALSLRPGDLFNYGVLLEDVRRLAEGRSGDVRLVPRSSGNGSVRVTFELGPPDSAGPITAVRIEGNTVIADEVLREALALDVGDTFTSTIAQEDFRRLRDAYLERGYFVPNQPSFNYLDGTYVQRVQELTIGAYDVSWEGEQGRTLPFVITRYLPEPGSVLNLDDVDAGLRQVAQLGIVQPVAREILPTDVEGEVVVNVVVRSRETGVLQPAAQYGTDTGFSATVSYTERNFLGRAHDVGAEVSAQTTDLGLQLGGSIRYSIPWLYIDYEDFIEVPTSLSASLFSVVTANNALTADGSTEIHYPGAPAGEQNAVRVGEYLQRDSGFSVSVGRPVLEDLRVRLSARVSYSQYALEPPAEECELDDEGNVTNAERCALPTDVSAQYLPQSGVSSFFSANVTYDNRDNPDFPREGFALSSSLGVGIGSDYRNPDTGEQSVYAYEEIQLGAKTYVTLSQIAPEVEDRNHVFAVRLNLGHQFGDDYPASRRFRVGKTNVESTQLRGYTLEDFNLSQTYAIGSVEYRYDFALETVATQTIIGIAFVDLGYASHVPGFDPYATPLFASAGLGVQVNLGFAGVVLPALRFDYGFSERNPSGVFAFRVGPVF